MFSFGNVRKLTSICVVLGKTRSKSYTEKSSLKDGLQTVPSFVVEGLLVGQVQGFLHRNSTPLLGKNLFAMTLCFDPDRIEDARHQMND
jgi:hypothetical protein